MATNNLVRKAKAAAIACAKARLALKEWTDAFEYEYGHCDISDLLVDSIDYNQGETSFITAKFIDDNSAPGNS